MWIGAGMAARGIIVGLSLATVSRGHAGGTFCSRRAISLDELGGARLLEGATPSRTGSLRGEAALSAADDRRDEFTLVHGDAEAFRR